MPKYSRIRRQQLIQQAEGYLELVMLASERFPLKASYRIRLAGRAIESLNRLDHAGFRSGRAHYLRGQAHRLIEKFPQAIDALLRARELDSSSIQIHLALAWCYKRISRLDLAIETLEEALELDPDRGILHYNLACYWSLTNNVGLTLAHLTRAFDLNSEYRNLVTDEADFDPVRQHPEFSRLVACCSPVSPRPGSGLGEAGLH